MEENGYASSLEFLNEIPEEAFPEFLFSTIQGEYGGEYIERALSSDPITLKAMSLKHKYNDYFEWVDAMDAYDEYLEYLEDLYGGSYGLRHSAKLGLVSEYLPDLPTLKRSRRNKQMMALRLRPSRPIAERYSKDEMDLLIQEWETEHPAEEGEIPDRPTPLKSIPKQMRKQIRDVWDRLEGRDRRRNIYSGGAYRGADLLASFLDNASKGRYDVSGEYKDAASLLDIVREMEDEEWMDPDIMAWDATASRSFIGFSNMASKEEIRNIEIMKYLMKEGFDITGTSTLDKRTVQMIQRDAGIATPMTKKELKKMRKQEKEAILRKQQNVQDVSSLMRVMERNKRKPYASGKASFTMEDLRHDDD